MKRIMLCAFGFLAVLLNPRLTVGQCTRDDECKGDRICVDGVCVNPEKGVDLGQTSVAARGGSGSMGKGYVNIHPLGLLQFGPLVQLGINTRNDFFITAHYRYHALGLVSQAISWAYDADYAKWSSMAAGVGMTKYMSSQKPGRFYA
jgi:hypothetical protein